MIYCGIGEFVQQQKENKHVWNLNISWNGKIKIGKDDSSVNRSDNYHTYAKKWKFLLLHENNSM